MLLATPRIHLLANSVTAALGWLFWVAPAQAQRTDALEITGLNTKPRTLTTADLARLPRLEQAALAKAGQQHQYSGVALATLAQLMGVPQGKELHGAALAHALVVTAADGYTVVFALPELDPTFATQTVLLADRCHGQPLPAAAGPYRVIVPQEKRPARWVRQVKALRVVVIQP